MDRARDDRCGSQGQLDLLILGGRQFSGGAARPRLCAGGVLKSRAARADIDAVPSPDAARLLPRRCCCCRPPRATRFPGRVIETTTERRVIFSPEIDGARVIGRGGSEGRCLSGPGPGACGQIWRLSSPSPIMAALCARGDRGRWCRSTRASSTWRRPATSSSMAGRISAPIGHRLRAERDRVEVHRRRFVGPTQPAQVSGQELEVRAALADRGEGVRG